MQRIICIYIVCLIFIPTSTSLVIPSAYLHIHLQCIPIQDMPRCQDRFQRIQEQSNYLASFVPWILNLPDFSLGKRQTHNFFFRFFSGILPLSSIFFGPCDLFKTIAFRASESAAATFYVPVG